MNPIECTWQPIAAQEWNLQQWTHGPQIEKIADLYSPAIFGARNNLRCECGRVSGIENVGEYCLNCGVFVTADIDATHRQRVGRMPLAAPIQHPLASTTMIQDFPIAPIAYRRDKDGRITSLGKKYELVAHLNFSAKEALGPRYGGEGYFERVRTFDLNPLRSAIQRVVGIYDDWDSAPASFGRDDCLLSLVLTGLARLQPDVNTLVRCCGIVLKITTAV